MHMNSKSTEMDVAALQRLFSTCDINKSGRIEYEDFTVVCKELSVPNAEISALFKKFDVDGDGYINFGDFSSRYNEVSETLDIASLGQPTRSAWEEFEEKLDGGIVYLGRTRDPVVELYQQICSLDPSLLQQYEELVRVLVGENREHQLENQQLESSLRRTEEATARQLAELEEDLQQQLVLLEQRVREEEHLKLETAVEAMQKKHESEVADVQAAVDKLRKENECLRSSLNQTQTTVSVLQAELDRLKNESSDERLQHERETEHLKAMLMECQSYSSHIAVLQEMNKKLYDSNDGLRSALAQNILVNNRKPSRKESSTRRLKPIRQSTLKRIRWRFSLSAFLFLSCCDVVLRSVMRTCFPSSVDESMDSDPSKGRYSHVASWADKYLDSGVSITTETAASSYDSDDSRQSVETVHHSYSCAFSDAEVSELKSEMGISAAVSRCGSIASSIRRRLSAFPARHAEKDIPDGEVTGPMYRVVLAGDAGSGKSSFLLRLCKNEFRGDIQTTLGVDFQMKRMLVDGEKTTLQIWDTAGQERFRSIARSYFRKAHGVLLLYDVTSESSFLHIREWVDQIRDATGELLPLCIVGNKVDLRVEQPAGASVSRVNGEKLAMAYSALFCETSAKEGTNVVEAVLHLAREVKKNERMRRKSEPKVKLSIADGKRAVGNCCSV
nr:ras and EF-hand domain-containing protein-like isoform X3 [Paramormyrops kingsleyae]